MSQTATSIDPAVLRKVTADSFIKNGFNLQSDGLKHIQNVFAGYDSAQLHSILADVIKNIYSILKQTGKEGTFLIGKELIEEALKLGLNNPNLKSKMSTEQRSKSGHRRTFGDGTDMNTEPSYTYVDKISEKLAMTLILLSNFGEYPNISFRNQARELTVISSKNKSIIVPGKELIEKWIEKYHKMRYLIKNCGAYIYQHDYDNRGSHVSAGAQVLSEIGTLFGSSKGGHTVFGLVYRKGKKLYVQDNLSSVEINIDKAEYSEGFYHEKHFLILKGDMVGNIFHVHHISHPNLDKCDPERMTAGKNYDLYGYKTKYLSLIKDLSTVSSQEYNRGSQAMDNELSNQKYVNQSNSKKYQLAKKYLGLFEFDSNPTGIIYVFSDFNIQDHQNLSFLENVILSLPMRETDKKPDAIIICGPFMTDILINSKEDQLSMEEAYNNFASLLLKHQQFIKNTIIGLVPDITDPVMNLMPRKSLPEYLLQKISTELPKFCLLENPVHLSHCVITFLTLEQANHTAKARPPQNPSQKGVQHLPSRAGP